MLLWLKVLVQCLHLARLKTNKELYSSGGLYTVPIEMNVFVKLLYQNNRLLRKHNWNALEHNRQFLNWE